MRDQRRRGGDSKRGRTKYRSQIVQACVNCGVENVEGKCSTINATRRVCVVASISDVSRLTKKDEKSYSAKSFIPRLRSRRRSCDRHAPRRLIVEKTFYRERGQQTHRMHPQRCSFFSFKPIEQQQQQQQQQQFWFDALPTALATRAPFRNSRTSRERVIVRCSHYTFKKGLGKPLNRYKRRTTTPKTQTCGGGDGLSRVVVHPHLFTDAQRALVWRFASAALRRLRSEEERKKKTSTKKKKRKKRIQTRLRLRLRSSCSRTTTTTTTRSRRSSSRRQTRYFRVVV